MKIVPSSASEYYFKPIAEYDVYNIKFTIQKFTSELLIKDNTIREALDEIVHYIMATNFEDEFNVKERNGIIFFHNGYPLLGFKNKIAQILPMNFHTSVLIDINNYIFNKNIMTQLKMKNRLEKKKQEQKRLVVVLIIIMVSLIVFTTFVKWRL